MNRAHAPAAAQRHYSDERVRAIAAPIAQVDLSPTAFQAMGGLLGRFDRGGRNRVLGAIGQTVGNQAVQRLMGNGAPTVQRWAMSLDRSTEDCAVVASWINAHTPHPRGGWARTRVHFSWTGTTTFTGEAPNLEVSVTGASVSHTKSVDMPIWSPTEPGMRSAWGTAWANLRAHEAEHERIGDDWRSELETRLASLRESVPSEAAGRRRVEELWNSWKVEHQDAQSAIDPFFTNVNCPDIEEPE